MNKQFLALLSTGAFLFLAAIHSTPNRAWTPCPTPKNPNKMCLAPKTPPKTDNRQWQPCPTTKNPYKMCKVIVNS
jgi:hypothetical protein